MDIGAPDTKNLLCLWFRNELSELLSWNLDEA